MLFGYVSEQNGRDSYECFDRKELGAEYLKSVTGQTDYLIRVDPFNNIRAAGDTWWKCVYIDYFEDKTVPSHPSTHKAPGSRESRHLISMPVM
jgi:hypothetical protein